LSRAELFRAAPGIDLDIRFNRDIRPILSNNCFQCHGPDSAARQAGLRLDVEDVAKRDLPSGGYAIVEGDSSSSKIIHRIMSDDPDFMMPPSDSGKRLTDEEKSLLRAWIDQGAEWQPHWAFISPERPAVPETIDPDWPHTPIDSFILARLEQENLTPSDEAAKEKLIRRVTLDLTGLPPTIEEVDAFLADDSPDAFARVVDRLLASPRYGEHMARFWLDAARYGDTHGLHLDNERSIWRYRDWVIDAFNRNKPFDTFTIEQLAGDLLPDPTLDQLIATGFNRCNVTTSEGGAIDAEYLVEYAIDRVSTTSTVWMGLTAECARCHDHKFDPLSQREFYQLFAFFNNVAENAMDGNAIDPPPVVKAPTSEQKEKLDGLRDAIALLQAEVDAPRPEVDAAQTAWESEVRERVNDRWTVLDPESAISTNGATLTELDDHSILSEGENPVTDVYEVVAQTDQTDLRLIRLDCLLHESLPHGGPGRGSNANFVLSEFEVEVRKCASPQAAWETVTFSRAIADHSQANNEYWIEKTIDGVVDNINGWAAEGYNRREPRLAVFVVSEPIGFEGGTEMRVRMRFETQYAEHAIGRFRLSVSGEPQLSEELDLPMQSGWRVAGPIAAGSFEDAWETEHFPSDSDLDAARDTEHVAAITWRDAPEYIDGEVHLFEQRPNAAMYLSRTMTTHSARTVSLLLGSDDAVRIWINGEIVHENNIRRPVAPNQDRVAITLEPGENQVMMKVVNAGGDFGFYWSIEQDRRGPESFYITEIFTASPEELSDEESDEVRRFFRRNHSPQMAMLYDALQKRRIEEEAFFATIPVSLIMKEREEWRRAYVLDRGSYDKPLDEVFPATPAFLDAITLRDASPKGDDARETAASDEHLHSAERRAALLTRLDLANWLVDPAHPLTARVIVNRLWQQVFGTGLVRTSEDFGSQGSPPTHPELLDWLAVEFVESGWDVKRMLRLMATSATYRQSARATAALRDRDPENRLLARAPRHRLDAEMIRDQALFVSGLLVEKIGGPSVKPDQPPGLWEAVAYPTSTTARFMKDEGEAQYRRSLYTFWKRTSPPPNMLTFDAPTRESCTVRRPRTNTPLQALVLMNDPQFVEAARKFAERILREGGETIDDRVAYAFRAATSRSPAEDEARVLRALYEAEFDRFSNNRETASVLLSVGDSLVDESLDSAEVAAWTVIANTILSLDEAITKG